MQAHVVECITGEDPKPREPESFTVSINLPRVCLREEYSYAGH